MVSRRSASFAPTPEPLQRAHDLRARPNSSGSACRTDSGRSSGSRRSSWSSRRSIGGPGSPRWSNTTRPSLAVSSPSSTLASVDLPQPDSPTIASTSASLRGERDVLDRLDRARSPAAEQARSRRPGSASSVGRRRGPSAPIVDRLERVAGRGRRRPVDRLDPEAAALVPARAGDVAHRHVGAGRRRRRRNIRSAARNCSPSAARCGSGNWPGMGTSGLSFLFVPGIGIERKRPCV